jgi:hypothetical protein
MDNAKYNDGLLSAKRPVKRFWDRFQVVGSNVRTFLMPIARQSWGMSRGARLPSGVFFRCPYF